MNPENLQIFKEAAATNLWGAIVPEMLVAFLAIGLLLMEIFLPREKHRLIPCVAIGGMVAILAWFLIFSLTSGGGYLGQTTFAGMLYHDLFGQSMRAFFLLSGICVCYLGNVSLSRLSISKTEFYHITLVLTAAMMLLVQSHNFVMLFVALETVTVGFYVLVSYFRHSSRSLEAGLKFLILGALSSGLLLFGIVLLYGVAGNPELAGHTGQGMDFGKLQEFLKLNASHPLAITGMILVLSGVSFKIAAVPFQIWVPDVYQGAPTPVTAFLAVASKAAGFGILLALVKRAFGPMADVLVPILTMMAALTIILGNLAALNQQNTKRLMGLSGIAHAGYLLVGVTAAVTIEAATGAVVFYLYTYLLASFAVFGVMVHMAGPDDTDQQLEHYGDLSRRSPFMATVLVIGLGSLAGIPPLVGFIGKLLLFIAAFEAKLYFLLGVSIVGVVISIYYYFGWMKIAVFRVWNVQGEAEGAPVENPLPTLGTGGKIVLGGLAAATVITGFFQGPLANWLTGM